MNEKRETLNKIKVSVIIPVYNPGEGIKKCLRCLQNQSLEDIEMIFVDDCGQDDSMIQIAKAAESDRRIKILKNKYNIGAGQSRNQGIEEAQGEYLSFVDPDDYISLNFLEELYTSAIQAKSDIAKGTCRVIDEAGDVDTTDEPSECLNETIKEGLEVGSPLYTLFTFQHWTAIYDGKLFRTGNVRYGSSSFAEDDVFLLRACYAAESISFATDAIYYYVAREESSIRHYSLKRWNGALVSLNEILNFIETKGIYTKEAYYYASGHIASTLALQKAFEERQGMVEEALPMRREIRDMVIGLSYAEALLQNDSLTDALVKYDVNLSPNPIGMHFHSIQYEEYLSRVKTWVDFICEHPEYGNRSHPYIWYVFENAITCKDWEEEKDITRKKALKELRKQANRLPNKKILTDDFFSMKLFVDYGINTFGIRKTMLGKKLQKILKHMRRIIKR